MKSIPSDIGAGTTWCRHFYFEPSETSSKTESASYVTFNPFFCSQALTSSPLLFPSYALSCEIEAAADASATSPKPRKSMVKRLSLWVSPRGPGPPDSPIRGGGGRTFSTVALSQARLEDWFTHRLNSWPLCCEITKSLPSSPLFSLVWTAVISQPGPLLQHS